MKVRHPPTPHIQIPLPGPLPTGQQGPMVRGQGPSPTTRTWASPECSWTSISSSKHGSRSLCFRALTGLSTFSRCKMLFSSFYSWRVFLWVFLYFVFILGFGGEKTFPDFPESHEKLPTNSTHRSRDGEQQRGQVTSWSARDQGC